MTQDEQKYFASLIDKLVRVTFVDGETNLIRLRSVSLVEQDFTHDVLNTQVGGPRSGHAYDGSSAYLARLHEVSSFVAEVEPERTGC